VSNQYKRDFFDPNVNCDLPCGKTPQPDAVFDPSPPTKRQISNEELMKQIEEDEESVEEVVNIECPTSDTIAAPTVTATNEDQTGFIIINWTEVEDAMGYEIYRDSSITPIKIVGYDVLTFRDTETYDANPHTYWIRAFKYYRDWPI
jgi:hypothetical protein